MQDQITNNASALNGLNDPIVPIDFSPPDPKRSLSLFKFRWIHGFGLGFLLCAGFAGWFVMTAKSVFIEIDPITASIEIDSKLSIRLANRYLLRQGSYGLTLANEGYVTSEVELIVNDQQAQTHPYILTLKPGILTFDSGALRGARVQIDTVDVGITPLVEVSVAAGEHDLLVSKDRYLSYRGNIEVEGKLIAQEITIELLPAWAEVGFSSTPQGADVLVDGQPIGITPLKAEILQGDHEIILKLVNHKAWIDDISVTAGEHFTVPIVPLEEADGLVFIRTVPANANITIDGIFRGQTPLEVALRPGVNHEISLFKDGYNAHKATIKTVPNDEKNINFDLAPILVKIRIIADPPNAELYVNGEYRGLANQTIELLATMQKLEIRKEGYVPFTNQFTSRPGIEQEIKVILTSLEQARIDAIKPLITTSVGQSLKLFNPGEFTMGASRREAGRRPNETLRNIILERPFYLAIYEVNNAQYKEYDSEHSSGTLQGQSMDTNNQPVVDITWQDAAKFCNWLSARESLDLFYNIEEEEIVGFNVESTGYRLPTEAEWAWVARSTGDGNVLKYSWGDRLPPADKSGNFADFTTRNFLGNVLADYDDNFLGTSPIGYFDANFNGLYDLSGNVSEWVHDVYGSVSGLSSGKETDPLGVDIGKYHTIRGSSWAHGSVTELRLSYRDFGEEGRNDLGFRIARYLEE